MKVVRDVQTSLIEGMERPIGPLPQSIFAGSNADLMAAIAPLYLSGSVLDPTYGNGDTAGGWWRRFTPDPFTHHDLSGDGVDFRSLPYRDRAFDTVCFDPPYVPSGTPSKDFGVGCFRERFGIDRATGYGREDQLRALIFDGLAECARVARAFLLVKCMEFTSSRRFHDWPVDIAVEARTLGWVKHDVIVHNTGPGPGGHNIFEVQRARRAHSYLLVFERPKNVD
jgi:hypothetical protein